VSEQRARKRFDPKHVEETDTANDFTKDWAGGSRTDDRVLRIAGLLGRQTARELLRQAANDNQPDGSTPTEESQS